jgi:excisionase family DNA binding protein
MPDDLLTATQAAKDLGVTRNRVNALIRMGHLPAQRFGMQNAIRRGDLEKVRGLRAQVGRPRTRR